MKKHGIAVEDIESFFQGNIQIMEDLEHSSAEARFLAVGEGLKGKPCL